MAATRKLTNTGLSLAGKAVVKRIIYLIWLSDFLDWHIRKFLLLWVHFVYYYISENFCEF